MARSARGRRALSAYIRLKLEEFSLFASAEGARQGVEEASRRELPERQELAPDPHCIVWSYGSRRRRVLYGPVLRTLLYDDGAQDSARHRLHRLDDGGDHRLDFFGVFGWLSDYTGRGNVVTLGFALRVVTYWPVFIWLRTFKNKRSSAQSNRNPGPFPATVV